MIDSQDNEFFIPFQDFLGHVEHASYENFSSNAVTHSGAFEEMRSHIKYMYAGVTAENVTSFWVGGLHVDCIAIQEQPTVFHFGIERIEKPPAPGVMPMGSKENRTTRFSHHAAHSMLKQGLTDKFGNAISCPDHTIPMSRLTLEKLTKSATLRDFLRKPRTRKRSDSKNRPRAQTDEPDNLRLYAIAGLMTPNLGGNSVIELWNPAAELSMSQQWYINGDESIEGGWMVQPEHFHTTASVLFVHWTPDDYVTGCFNLECPGFVQVYNTWVLGTELWTSYSTEIAQWAFGMQWQLYDGHWWLYMSASAEAGTFEAVGYYPASIFPGGQLPVNAVSMEVGGEVGRNVNGGVDWPAMGSGALSSAGITEAAFQRSVWYLPQNPGSQNLVDGEGLWMNMVPLQVDRPCYSLGISNHPDGISWGNYILYGGPGGSIATCGQGT